MGLASKESLKVFLVYASVFPDSNGSPNPTPSFPFPSPRFLVSRCFKPVVSNPRHDASVKRLRTSWVALPFSTCHWLSLRISQHLPSLHQQRNLSEIWLCGDPFIPIPMSVVGGISSANFRSHLPSTVGLLFHGCSLILTTNVWSKFYYHPHLMHDK